MLVVTVRDGRIARTLSLRFPAVLLAAVLLVVFGTATVSAAGWQTETVDASGRVGLFTSLALDDAGNPRISYFDDTNGALKYAWRDGSCWHTETADAAGTVGRWSSLALDSAGNPRISYFDETNDDLKFAWRDESGWQTETVAWDGWVGEFTSLALDTAGNPRVSYLDRTYNDLMYAWRNETGWHTERVDAYGILGWYTSLALDSDGNPRITYLVEWTDDLKYAWRNESGWHFEVVDTEGYVGKCSSLVLDAAGNPRVSYFDDTFENKDDLKYAWRDDAGWHNETVDTEGQVGWDTSLALDPAGDPRISYFDDTNNDLKYAWKDAAGWHLEVVDAAGVVGQWTSLALDGAGNPRISYFDTTNGDLKYAAYSPPPPVLETVPGGAAAPADLDGDGLSEDVNGNGRKDFADVTLFFVQMEWIAANMPLSAFDYNGNGRIDFADAARLFTTLGDPVATPIAAAFTANTTTGPAPLAVRFASTSTGPFDDLAWTVSSGREPVATMNGTAPEYTFEAAGAYTVALTARNTSTNRSDTATQSVTVTGPAGANLPYPAAHVLPGRVEAEDYDVSVGSPAYADTTAINEGGAYRFDAVDIEVISGNYDVGWIRSGESLNYSVDTIAPGDFALTLNVANAEAITKPVQVYLDGVPAGEVRVGPTGNWVVFREFAASAPLAIPEGRHVLTIAFEGVEKMNFDWLHLAAIVPTPTVTVVPEAPYPAAHILPATIEAEDFDLGGEGVA
ncbi:MAG: carbohydrate-binding protein, partial [Thermotogota bacterium]